MDDQHAGEVTVYEAGSFAECRKQALVLHAVRIEHDIRRSEGRWAIIVRSEDEPRARAELEAGAGEDQLDAALDLPALSAPIVPQAVSSRSSDGWGGVLGFAVVLMVADLLARQHAFGIDWFAAGRNSAGLVRQGEWWRTITALTLHVDLMHITVNLACGLLFGLFAGKILGSALAWFSILLAGALGNAADACLRSAEHTSVGASTAVFAALGILSAHTWQQQRYLEQGRLRRFAPLVGGIVLLSMLGTAGERTDVLAHVTGFVAGIVFGACLGRYAGRLQQKFGIQLVCGTAALGIVILAWWCAL